MNIQDKCQYLMEKIRSVSESIRVLSSKISDDPRDDLLFNRLVVSKSNGKAIVLLAKHGFARQAMSIMRCLLEDLFWVYWVVGSKERANKIVNLPKAELTRLIRNILRGGHGQIYEHSTGQDKTDVALKKFEEVKLTRPPKIATIAHESGLERIYRDMYGPLSIYLHGHRLPGEEEVNVSNALSPTIDATTALLDAIHRIVEEWLLKRQIVSQEELEELFKVKLA